MLSNLRKTKRKIPKKTVPTSGDLDTSEKVTADPPVQSLAIVPVGEIRQSQHLQQKITGREKATGRGKGKVTPKQGTNTNTIVSDLDHLKTSFPFDQSSDSDVNKLFEASGFSLGKT
jgi:hypothetical protein